MHLVFLIHGLFGQSSHMDTMKEILEEKLDPDKYLVYSARKNAFFKTFEGVQFGAKRNYLELMEVMSSHPEVTHLSIVGYSMGGLYARYMVGLLYEASFFDKIVPVNFVTFATPHLGTSLWTPGFRTSLLNGLARALLGPSGFDLMSRGPHGVLDEMVQPESPFILGLQMFKHLTLYSNAIGDRTVRFWTSYITDRNPFSRNHRKESNLVYFTYNGDIHKPVFVDLKRSTLKNEPDTSTNPKKSSGWPFLFYVLLGPVVLTMLTMSMVSWLKIILVLPFYKFRVHRSIKKWKNISTADFHKRRLERIHKEHAVGEQHGDHERSQSRRSQFFNEQDLTEEIHVAIEEAPSIEENSSSNSDIAEASNITSISTTTAHEPEPCFNSDFVNSSQHRIPFTPGMTSRMERLSILPWEKYVVYIHHYRTHANIIDRLKEGSSQGTEILRFFSKQIAA